jgi:Na+/melibiose symporter-like transporter
MDLNELKDQMKKVKAPEATLTAPDSPIQSMDDLIERLTQEDARDRKRLRGSKLFFTIAGIIYVLIFVLTWIYPPDTDPLFHRNILGLFALLCLSLGFVSARKARELAGLNYAEPVGFFLKLAAQRCRFINPRDLWFMVPYFIILTVTAGNAWMSGFRRYLSFVEPSMGLPAFVVFWLVAMAVGTALGLRDWKRRKAPLLHAIEQLRAELTAEEPEGVKEVE